MKIVVLAGGTSTEREVSLTSGNGVYHALKDNYPESTLILQVHDELIIECPCEIADAVAELISTEMQQVAQLSVPLVAEAKSGESWYGAK